MPLRGGDYSASSPFPSHAPKHRAPKQKEAYGMFLADASFSSVAKLISSVIAAATNPLDGTLHAVDNHKVSTELYPPSVSLLSL